MVVERIPPIIGLLYVIVGIPLIAYLWYKGKFSRKIRVAFTIFSIVLGFLIFSPMAPFQLQAIVLNDIKALGVPIAAAAVVLLSFIIVVLITGRIFCGYLCPIGAVQELAYDVPVTKVKVPQKHSLIVIRFVVLLLFFVAAFFSIGILTYFGIQQFFYLTVASIFFFVFLGILIISLVVYRPFCRIICPLGALYSLAAMVSLLKLRRSQACTDCKSCERECPTNEAKREDAKGECYLCGRCVDVCPVEGALIYRRTQETSEVTDKKREELSEKVLDLKDLVIYQDGTVASLMIVSKKGGNITLFSFDENEGLSEHTAPFDAVVTILDGQCEVWVVGKTFPMKSRAAGGI